LSTKTPKKELSWEKEGEVRFFFAYGKPQKKILLLKAGPLKGRGVRP